MSGVVKSGMFKSVPGGYIFQLPHFHRTQAYLVNESEKTKIAEIAGSELGTRSLIVFLIVLLAGGGRGGLIDVGGGTPVVASVLFSFCSWVIVQFGGIALMLHLKQRQLEPLLAGLPRSNERLFPAINVPDVNRAHLLYAPASLQFIAIWCGSAAYLLGQRFEQAPLADMLSTLLFTLFLSALVLGLFFKSSRPKATPSKSSNA
jgi:hypothetical protein